RGGALGICASDEEKNGQESNRETHCRRGPECLECFRCRTCLQGFHFAPPAFCSAGVAGSVCAAAPGACRCGGTNSIRALVRLLSTKILFATRRTSALLTASILSSWRKSCLQSPKRVWYSAS